MASVREHMRGCIAAARPFACSTHALSGVCGVRCARGVFVVCCVVVWCGVVLCGVVWCGVKCMWCGVGGVCGVVCVISLWCVWCVFGFVWCGVCAFGVPSVFCAV